VCGRRSVTFRRAQFLEHTGKVGGPRPTKQSQGCERRQAERLPYRPLRSGEPARVGQGCGFEDGVVRDSCLHKQRPRVLTAAQQPRRAGQEGKSFLAGAIPGGKELLVEVQERHCPYPSAPPQFALTVEDSLSADQDRRLRQGASAGYHLPDRAAGQSLELIPGPAHADAQLPQRVRAAGGADDGSRRTAVAAPEFVVEQGYG
jgi:hypothetical protein